MKEKKEKKEKRTLISKELKPVNTRLSTTSRYSSWMAVLRVCKDFWQNNKQLSWILGDSKNNLEQTLR
jgi:hypothetical protein